MTKWYALPRNMRTSQSDYDSNIEGINIVFGAVLGFVLATSEKLGNYEFAMVLAMSASAVIGILYLGSSAYKLFYAVFSALIIWGLPEIFSSLGIAPIPKLQPTLAVWAAMVLFLQIVPRERTSNIPQENPQ